MKALKVHISARILLYWYGFIFISTELLSYFHILEKRYILIGEFITWTAMLFFLRQEILQAASKINHPSKTSLLILVLFLLTFIQGFFSAPSTTDSMVYHLPRVMYWIQERTLEQDVIRNSHDFMAPFSEYILLHLYFIVGDDKLLFFSQWLGYLVSIYIAGVIFLQLGGNKKYQPLLIALVASLPLGVMQAVSTQTDMVVTGLLLTSIHLALILAKKFKIEYLILFGINIGLGILSKPTFFIYVLIPLGIITFIMKKNFKFFSLFLGLGLITFIINLRYFYQNISLYGFLLGKHIEDGQDVIYTNQLINPAVVLLNLVKNVFLEIPFPLFRDLIRQLLKGFSFIFGIDINDQRITWGDSLLSIKPIIYPQEDIVSNPIHLFVILVGGMILLTNQKLRKKSSSLNKIFFFSIAISFIAFCALLKWQPYHVRLHLPFLVTGTITSAIIITNLKNGFKILNLFKVISIILATVIILFNVSRPYISYFFYNEIKFLAPHLSSIPESFILKPRTEQYFNARYYWYYPYHGIINMLAKQRLTKEENIAFDLPDGFEYPLWVLMRKYDLNYRIVPMPKITKRTTIISTSKDSYTRKGYNTTCIKTEIEYGYACLSIPK